MNTVNPANVNAISEVQVTSSARLHMGFFDLHGGLGRKFGGIGVSLSAPSQVLTASLSGTMQISGASSSRVFSIAQQFIERLNLKDAVYLNVQQAIPEHAGLGSGTQLALAIGAAISRLHQLNLSTRQIAELTGRGGRSGIGIAAFDYGGLLIDGGRASNNDTSLHNKKSEVIKNVPPLLARYKFPEKWRILLILDNNQSGIHGDEERSAFNNLPAFSENLAAHLCRYVLMQAMPALVEHDLPAFGGAIQELQTHVGDYFSPAQGGRYASKKVGEVLQYLKHIGVACFGQSSWGPTGFAVFEDEIEAERHLLKLKTAFTDCTLSWIICSGQNHGAEFRSSEL
ncbi:beta-ribofuranosylaminobenzene 5'-phosphate synthase family protein [Methylotenera sp.]|uniref:beta-ribofuranosylaminobenzene 5'-phosphate synthase family protein n=1 Tax=Methylotenera sp. TaxID=2051956 RepID=UPI002736D65C|nr:beta-ribofuranosylaminobenzene 5'-phosphate synthase family protein [Methylotenera sp.]MDP3210682.1 GHMP kinase [Methylotenera sp.]